MPSNKKILILPGDGIGLEVMNEVLNIIDWMTKKKSVLGLDKEQIILYNDVYKLITPYIKPDNPNSLLMIS